MSDKIAKPPKHWNIFPSELDDEGNYKSLSWRQKHIYSIKRSGSAMAERKFIYNKKLEQYNQLVEKECIKNMDEFGLYISHRELCDLSEKIDRVQRYIDAWANFDFIDFQEDELKVLEMLLKYRPEIFSNQYLNLSTFESE